MLGRIARLIARVFKESHETYGALRIQAELADDHGFGVGRKRVARLQAERSVLLLLRVRGACPEIDDLAGLVAYDPGVVTRLDPRGCSRADLGLRTIVHDDLHASR
jgi:hypothetical protein